ncbi:hypothetical protein B7494_g889 [Chlorociboria aeruginascens]|nr:hypothetical protein B7494_g889 [Chlorociboria aeruginascens]
MPPTPIHNVVILGATGALGHALVPSLQKAGYHITCISRLGSTSAHPPGVVDSGSADYESVDSLRNAFRGQDAVIEAFNPAAATSQQLIVQAALGAGVVHLITPDFSCDTFNPHMRELLIFEPKIQAQEELERIITESGGALTWTAVIVGPWFDWATDAGQFWIDKKNRNITRFGSGDQKYSMSRYLATGDATVAVLKNLEYYRNRPAYFASHTISTNRLIALVEELGFEGWGVVDVPIHDFLAKGRELWNRDTEMGLRYRMNTPAYTMLATVSLVDENNRYGADFGDKVEPGWDEGEEALREGLRKLLA